MIYIFYIIIAVISIVFSAVARKQIAESGGNKDVKAKWQLISGLMGLAVMILIILILFI